MQIMKMMKAAVKGMIGFFLLLAGGALLGTLLLTAAYVIPVNPEKAAASLQHADVMGGSYPIANRNTGYFSYFTSYEPAVLDESTDLIILRNVLDEGEGSGWMFRDASGWRLFPVSAGLPVM